MNDRSVLFAVYGQHGKNTLEYGAQNEAYKMS